jgi:hypothetical protein
MTLVMVVHGTPEHQFTYRTRADLRIVTLCRKVIELEIKYLSYKLSIVSLTFININ